MEYVFDKYLKHELDSINDAPIPSHLWDKEKTWGKIAAGLKPQVKTISIRWFYAAASVVFFLLMGATMYYNNSSSSISHLENENSILLKRLTAENILLKQNKNIQGEVITVVQTKKTIKRMIVQNTVYIHDTVTIMSKISKPVNQLIAENNQQFTSESSVVPLSDMPKKKEGLHYVIDNDPIVSVENSKLKLITSKSLFQEGKTTENMDKTFKIALY